MSTSYILLKTYKLAWAVGLNRFDVQMNYIDQFGQPVSFEKCSPFYKACYFCDKFSSLSVAWLFRGQFHYSENILPFFNIKLFTCIIISLKICFFIYFPAKRKQQSQQSSLNPPTTVTGVSNLVFKFDLTLDILEEDNKGFSSAARDKNCFKLRQDLRKKVFITVQQLTNRHLIVERFVTIPVAEKRRMIMSLMITLSYLVWSVTMVLLRTLID